eukprot:scaffold2657_cov33-Tisochrysis_lutea.AAC.1
MRLGCYESMFKKRSSAAHTLDTTPTIIGSDLNCVEDSAHDSQRIGDTLYSNTHGEKWKALTKVHRLQDAHHTMRLGPNVGHTRMAATIHTRIDHVCTIAKTHDAFQWQQHAPRTVPGLVFGQSRVRPPRPSLHSPNPCQG